jgi:hypothetical protein
MEKIPPVKGTRDFYPDQMALRNWIVAGWRAVSQRNGFVEYDGPIFEYLQLYTQKSGDDIASQLFSMTDRGGRDLAIRPEITPTLARMVNQQISSLARPIKWFSVPRLCRAERPQKGRLREFFQWNCDIIGSDSVYADADCIYTAIDYLRSVGLGSDDIVVKISSRAMLAELLKHLGFAQEQFDSVYALLDKRAKLPAETFIELAQDKIADKNLLDKLFAMIKRYQKYPFAFVAMERGVINNVLQPLIKTRQRKSGTYFVTEEITRVDSKHVHAATLQARFRAGAVKLPDTNEVKLDVVTQLLNFEPGATNQEDDWIDSLVNLTMCLDKLRRPFKKVPKKKLTLAEEEDEVWKNILASGKPASQNACPFTRLNCDNYVEKRK